jgi:hypothetical protein
VDDLSIESLPCFSDFMLERLQTGGSMNKRYTLKQLREMFAPTETVPARKPKPDPLVRIGTHRGIAVFRDTRIGVSRSKYTPHQGTQECARRVARGW